MAFDPENLNPAHRFFWPNSEVKDADGRIIEEWVDFRIMSDEDRNAMLKKLGIKTVVKHVVNKETRAMNEIVGSNIQGNDEKVQQVNDEVADYCIVAWHLVTLEGKEIECTRENKIKFMRKSPVFETWATECLSKLRKGEKDQSEAEIKN
jgi:hypothetical protein